MSKEFNYSFIENGNFIVFEDGRIFKKLDPPVSSGGYKFVRIGDKSQPLHRIVASAFIPNPENKPEVNHIDGNKCNNAVSNLEWVTRDENVKHAKNNGLYTGPKRKDTRPSKAKIREHREQMGLSQKQLAAALGVDSSAVSLWESEKTAPTMKNLIKLAELFSCSPGDLF